MNYLLLDSNVLSFLDFGNILAFNFNPEASPPPGLEVFATNVLSWLKWIAAACAVGGIIWIAIQMMVGRRNRSQMAADGLSGLPWVVGGLILVAIAATFADWLLDVEANFDNSNQVIVNQQGPTAGGNTPN